MHPQIVFKQLQQISIKQNTAVFPIRKQRRFFITSRRKGIVYQLPDRVLPQLLEFLLCRLSRDDVVLLVIGCVKNLSVRYRLSVRFCRFHGGTVGSRPAFFFIGFPVLIELSPDGGPDHAEFLRELSLLMDEAFRNDEDAVRRRVAEIVPTYRPAERAVSQEHDAQ